MKFNNNKLCSLLKINYPIILAGMSGLTNPKLVAAVSNAGGLGILGAESITKEKLHKDIKRIKKMTEKPFGINLLLAKNENRKNDRKDIHSMQKYLNTFRNELSLEPRKDLNIENINEYSELEIEDKIDIILKEKVPVISFGLGDPSKYIKKIQDSNNTKIISMITTVDEALSVTKCGVDIVMAQGSEAGGHRSTFDIRNNKQLPLIGTFVLVPQVVDAINKFNKENHTKILVIAAGGIMDGRGLVASLSLGASGVVIGTRFLLSKECPIFPNYQKYLLKSKETDSIITDIFSGRPARTVRNKYVDKFLASKHQPLEWSTQWDLADDIYQEAKKQNNYDYYPLLSGQGVRLLHDVKSVKEIIKELLHDADKILKNMSKTI